MAIKGEQLICVLRRSTGLAALVSRRQHEFVYPRPVVDEPALNLVDIDPYIEEIRPFEEQDPGWCKGWGKLRASWDYLGRVSVFDARTLFHVLHVLTYTLSEGEAADIPPLKVEPTPPAGRPTAAHPRAYRGTKHQPPKVKRGAPVDLRPHLCVAGDVNRLLRLLAPCLPEARPLLQQADLSPEKFPYLLDTEGRVVDPYLQYCHAAGDQSVHGLPTKFRTRLLFWLRGQPWSAVAEALTLYWGLELGTEGPLLRCLSRFLAILPLSSALEWGRVLLQLPVDRRAAVAELLVEAHIQGSSPSARLVEVICEIDRLSPEFAYRHRMFTLLRSFRGEGNLDYLHEGVRLAQRYYPEYEFKDVERCDSFPRDAVEDFIEHVTHSTGPSARWRSRYALSLWEGCIELDGFNQFLEARPWNGMEPDAAYAAIDLFREIAYHDLSADAQQAKWRALRQAGPRLFEMLRDIEVGYQEKAIAYLRDLAWFWDEPDGLAQSLERYRLLLPRLCRQPFVRQTTPGGLTSLTLLHPPEWVELSSADDKSFRKLERASQRENDARLVERGLETLARTAGTWTVQAFRRCPSQLIRSVQVLGCIREPARQEIVHSWLRHPLVTLNPEAMRVERLVQEIERHRPADVYNPVPRNLRRAAIGEWSLRPGQLQRALGKVRDDLVVTRVDLLRRLALDCLARTVGPAPDTPEARHAVCLQGFIRDNRRALRRFLRAYFAGHGTYRIDHPANRQWLARHARIADTWLRGLQWCITTSDGESACLAIEPNPLEIMRLGTYVGTCLGIGGIMADSAAAVVLDINKQVVYARDVTGRVLGRQLLVLSEDEQLVCFQVYPLEAEAAIKQAFWEYDGALAKALGTEIHEPKSKDAGYKIANLVSTYWWDDEPWDGATDQDSETS